MILFLDNSEILFVQIFPYFIQLFLVYSAVGYGIIHPEIQASSACPQHYIILIPRFGELDHRFSLNQLFIILPAWCIIRSYRRKADDWGNVSTDIDNHCIHSAGRPVLPGILMEVKNYYDR